MYFCCLQKMDLWFPDALSNISKWEKKRFHAQSSCAQLGCEANYSLLLPPPSPSFPVHRCLFDLCIIPSRSQANFSFGRYMSFGHLDDIRDHRMPFIYWSFNWKELQCKFMLAINAETRFLQSAGLAAEWVNDRWLLLQLEYDPDRRSYSADSLTCI